ncbi:site-specific recombinase XerD [Chryseobacterium rhizosphaerae]|uniref:site-specific integrase n=1 Tax=Chryseobacterium rhizosphaerae TaxID=395937 RepID=UPI002859ABC1|nr:site-specific integrase [Chryseobacterium rhizosphaerae]MDR6546679.1 site-specific recombinase XerD [Chryseobacterium rhizosphaerae]MDR6546725.1 site-specific recombinase XerD [Chryseobacterium rhizosphaerae]
MATIKFVLNKSQHQRKIKSNLSMLMLRYSHQKQVTYFYTSRNLEDRYWDDKGQQVKRSYSGSDRFNIFLNKFRQKVEDIINDLMINGENPETARVKLLYTEQKEGVEKKREYTFFEYFEKYLGDRKGKIKHATAKTYRTTVNKLREYEKYARVQLNWHNIDMDFYDDFLEFYTSIEGLINSGFGKNIKNIKAIMNDAMENGFNTYNGHNHKNFIVLKEDVDNIYLTEEEIEKLIALDLSGDKTMERTRDLFVFACYTGLRFIDFSQVKPEHIVGDVLRIKTIKTGEWVNIPILPAVRVIMDKYKDNPNNLPESLCNQTMNKYLKKLGKKAEFNDKILKIRNKGKDRIEEVLFRYQMICTHTARRSFATNMFKRGVPSRVIMNITGHRTEKAFNSYIKISQDENAELFKEYFSKSA